MFLIFVSSQQEFDRRMFRGKCVLEDKVEFRLKRIIDKTALCWMNLIGHFANSKLFYLKARKLEKK